jgi:hypothetical protein
MKKTDPTVSYSHASLSSKKLAVFEKCFLSMNHYNPNIQKMSRKSLSPTVISMHYIVSEKENDPVMVERRTGH